MSLSENIGHSQGTGKVWLVYISACLAALCGITAGVYAGIIANKEYEVDGASYTVGYWVIVVIVLLVIMAFRKRDDASVCEDIRSVSIVLLGALIIAEFISWTRFPNLLVSARLSTGPLVALLCVIATAALLRSEYSAYRLVISIVIPVMISGRFTFHILGGAPPMTGITVFEIRCISELLIPITALILSFSLESSKLYMHRIRHRYAYLLYMENGEFPFMLTRVCPIKRIQTVLCILSLLLSIYSCQIGNCFLKNALLAVPLIIFVSDKTANKYLVALAILTKAVYDMSAGSFVKESNCFILFIVMDVLALIFALLGHQAACFVVNKIQITCLIGGLMIYACSTVARDNYDFYRIVSLYASEVLLYQSYSLFSLWGKWTSCSPFLFLRLIMNPETEE